MVKLNYNNFILAKWHYVGYSEHEGPIYDAEDYPIDNYEYEVDKERIIKKLSEYETLKGVDIRSNLDEIVKEYYVDLKEDFEDEAKEYAQEQLSRGELY